MHLTAQGHSKHTVRRQTRCERFEWKHSIEVSSVAFGCKHDRQHGETRGGNDKETHWYKVISPQFGNVQQKCWPSEESLCNCTTETELFKSQADNMLDIDVNAMIWCFLLSATMKAAVRTTKNTDFEKSTSCQIIHRNWSWIKRMTFLGRCSIDRNTTPWMSTTSLHDRAVKLSKAEVHVYSDSVLCPAKIHQHPHSMEAWNQNIEWFMVSLESGSYWRRTTRVRVDRFPRAHNTAVASWDPKHDDREQDPTWTVQRSNHLHVDVQRHLLETISWEVKAYAQKCPQSRWSIGHSSNREPKKNGTERTLAGQGLWDRSAGMMMLRVRGVDILYFGQQVH